MKRNLLITLSSTALLIIAVSSFNYLTKKTTQITTEEDRVKYEKFINEHEFSQIRYTQEEIEKMPKRDRPDLAWEQNYLETMNPALGRPEREKLSPILAMTKSLQLSLQSAAPGNAGAPWVERGPDNVGGRTRALAWDPTTPNKVWAGSVTGGLWFNNNITSAASSWQAVNNFWDNIAVTAIAFDPTNANTIYIGTGEGWGAAASRGAGIWKSTNGGTSFAQISSTTSFYYINDLVVRNESGTGVIYAAVAAKSYQGQFHGLANEGLQRSANGGTSWTQELPNVSGNPEAPTDIDIAANNTIWVGVDANAFGDGGGKIYSSTSGTAFTLRHNHGSPGRVNLSCAPSDANYIYAAFEVSSVLSAFKQSTNGGTSFTTRSEPNDADGGIPASDFSRGQAWYDLTLDVDPNNRDVVMMGGIDIFRTANGGNAWSQTSHWYGGFGFQEVHADQHAIVYKPGSSTEVLFGNDGGVFYTSNGNVTTPNLGSRINDYNVTQYYACAIHPTAGTNNFLAGAQDNGTQRYTSAGINSTTEATGGDGAYCHIDQTNGAYQTSSYVYNTFYHSSNSGASFSQINSDGGSGKFINPSDLDNNQNILYTYRSQTSLYRVSNFQSGSPAVNTFNMSNIGSSASHLSVSPYTTTSSTLFIGTTSGRVFKLTNAEGAETTTEITGGSFPTGSVSCIAFGASENEILVTFTNYGVNSVWYTANGGGSWVSKEGNLPDMPIRSALFNPNDYNEVILATEVGVWTTTGLNAGSPNWTTSSSGLANVRVDMLQMRTSDNEVIAATHGRGLFSSDGFNGVTPFTADFSANNTTPTINNTVTFTDLSAVAPTIWTWSFSPTTVTYQGGTNASSQNPQVSFNNPGTYTVTLLSTDGSNNDTEIKTSFINAVDFVADFSASNTTPALAQTVTFTDATTPSATGWTWSFAPTTVTYQGGTTANSQNPQVSFDNIGLYTATLVATEGSNNDTEIKVDYIDVTAGGISACHSPSDSLYTMSFEVGEDLSGWAIADVNADTNSWFIADLSGQAQGNRTGTRSIIYQYNTVDNLSPGDDWLFTNCFNLVTGMDYTFTFYWSTGAGFNENVEFFGGASQNVAGMTSSLRTLTNVSNNTTWTLETVNFTVASDGDFYFAWHNTSVADQFYFALEDINLVGVPSPTPISWNTQLNDTTINCDVSSLPTNLGTPTATEASSCAPGVTITSSDVITAGGCANESIITRTWTALDACSNDTTFEQTITIQDITNPTITCPANQAQNAINGVNTTLSNYTTMATISDNCSSNVNITVTQTPAIGSTQSVGTVNVTLTATDECGNTSNCNFDVVITGTSSITWTNQPTNTTIACDASSLPANTGLATATTTCSSGGLLITSFDATAPGACINASTITRTWSATDNCGNIETFDQIITIQDITTPTITCPVNQAQTAANGVNTTLSSYITMATTSDNCSSNANITVTQTPAIGSTQNVGTVNVTLTATDECNNSSNCNFDVVITAATTVITWTNQPTNTTIACDASSLPANTGLATATTTCVSGGLLVTSLDVTAAGACVNASTITRTWTATDNCGNSETFNQTVVIQDVISPTITCPSNQVQISTNGINTILNDYTSMATISDNCSNNANITVTQSPAISSTQNIGTVNITLTATDECGNSSNCNFDVVISGSASITWINQPANTTIACDASSLPANTGSATASTTCSSGGLLVTSSDVTTPGACVNASTITRTWNATDNCGNSETFNQIITIQDIINPSITCPANQAQTAANGVNSILNDYTSMATISDNCSSNANISVTQSPAVGSTQNVGTVNITLTATDECGNTSNCNFDVVISAGTTIITWTNQPINTTIDCDASSLPANTGVATATTTCGSGGLTVTSADITTAGSCVNESVITRSWSATDNCGVTLTFDQTVTIQDTTSPVITCPLDQTQIASNGTDTVLLDYSSMATISDNCSSNANITITQSPAIGSTQDVGVVNVTLTATDECGNTSNCSFDLDITNPNTTGIADNTRVNIAIFPNPNKGLFTIDLGSEMKGDVTIQVYNLLGSIVYNETKENKNIAYNLDLQHVEKGIYYLSIKGEQKSIVKKIMIM